MAAQGFADLDFEEFHRVELPRRLAGGNGEAAARAAEGKGTLAIKLPHAKAYTYVPASGEIAIEAGDAAADTVIELERDAWEGLVHDYESPPGLLYGGRVKCLRGKAMRLVAWEPALRAMYTGRPLFDSNSWEARDRRGAPLDAEQVFTLDSDREDMAHFLHRAGFLFVRDVFGPDEIAGYLEEAALLRAEAVKGDKLSWWGKNSRGEELLCRVTRAATQPRLRAIAQDPRLLSLVDLSDEKLEQRGGGSETPGVSLIFKNPDMTEGLSDIPWHRDCGMGGHSVMCPVLIASVYLTPANPETGELKMLPGSWQGTCGYMDPADPDAPRGASFDARPGDVSLHYGDVMHAAPPPTGTGLDSYRISAVTAYVKPDARNHRGAKSYNDVLHQREDGQIEHLSKVADRSGGGGD